MFGLARSSRALLAGGAFTAFAAAFVTTPLLARGAAELAPARPPLAEPIPSPTAFALVLPQRDPFARGPGSARSSAASASSPGAAMRPNPPADTARPPTFGVPAALWPLPANAGAPPVPFPLTAQSARVKAVITGPRPFALVEEAGTTRLVTLGDRIAGDTVAAITAEGVHLAHGGVLVVAPAAAPAISAPAVSPSRSDSGDR